jgi:hypothetical protein
MRRPLNWIVVFISLSFLLANTWFSGRNSQRELARLERPPVTAAMGEAIPPVRVAGKKPVPEFGYIRADGSFVPLTSTSPSWQ